MFTTDSKLFFGNAALAAAAETRQRVVLPAGLPVLAILAVAFVVVNVSRVLLAVPKDASTAIAISLSGAILVACFAISARSRLSAGALTGLAAVVALVLIVGGVVAAASGER